jgi:hypothetical protein
MKPEHRRKGIRHRYGINVGELGPQSPTERGVLVEGEGELNVSGGDVPSILPLRQRIDMKRQLQRVVRPAPSVGEAKPISLLVRGVHVSADVGKVVVDLLCDLLSLQRNNEGREERPWITSGGDDYRTTKVGCAGPRCALGAPNNKKEREPRRQSHLEEASAASRARKEHVPGVIENLQFEKENRH